MKPCRPVSRVTDYRPTGAGSFPTTGAPPARPGAAACPDQGTHEAVVVTYSDALLEAVIQDLGRRNLRDQSDHEIRWSAQRLSAARAERRRRRGLPTRNPAGRP